MIVVMVINFMPVIRQLPVYAATIRMHKTAAVESDEIRLGEISAINAETDEERHKLREMVMGKSPMPGKTLRISDEQVRSRLRREGVDLTTVDVVDNDVVAVSRTGMAISEKRIELIAVEYILNRVEHEDAEINIKRVRVGRSVVLPQGRMTYRVLPPKNMHLSRSISLVIQFSVDGEPMDRISVLVKIEILKPVAVARVPLARNKVVRLDDVEFRMMDIGALPSGIITQMENVVGMRPRRTININAVLRQDQFEMPPLVKKGDIVMIIAESGGLRITAHGEVRGKGGKGDTVRVVNLDSKKGIYGKVVDEGTVRVAF